MQAIDRHARAQDLQAIDRLAGAQDMQAIDRHARAQDLQATDRLAGAQAYARDRPASRGAGIYINIYRLAGAQA